MNKKNYLWLGLGVIVILAIIILLLNLKTTNFNKGIGSNQTNQSSDEGQNNVPNTNTPANTNSAAVAQTNNSNKATVTTGPSLSVMPGSPEAPKQEVVAADKIPATAIKLEVSAKGFNPNNFNVKAGQSVTLALTSTDNAVHVFLFPTASLMALTTMVTGGETKTVTFNAPAAGTYSFRDDIPSFRGNTGIMIVK